MIGHEAPRRIPAERPRPGIGERRRGQGFAAQLLREPLLHRRRVRIRVTRLGIVTAVGPADGVGGAGAFEGYGDRVGLVDPEERIGHALDKEGGGAELLEGVDRAAAVQFIEEFRARATVLGGSQEMPAQDRLEAATRGIRRRRRAGRGRECGAEEPRDPLLLHRPGPLRRVVGEQSCTEIGPCRDGGDGVDARIRGSGHHRDRPAIGRAGDTHPRIPGRIELSVRMSSGEIDHRSEVRNLEIGIVQVDAATRGTEPPCRIGEHQIALPREPVGLFGEVVLGPAETVGEDHDGMRARLRRRTPGRIQLHRGAVGLGPDRDLQVVDRDHGLGVRRSRKGTGQQHHQEQDQHAHTAILSAGDKPRLGAVNPRGIDDATDESTESPQLLERQLRADSIGPGVLLRGHRPDGLATGVGRREELGPLVMWVIQPDRPILRDQDIRDPLHALPGQPQPHPTRDLRDRQGLGHRRPQHLPERWRELMRSGDHLGGGQEFTVQLERRQHQLRQRITLRRSRTRHIHPSA